MIPMLAYVLVTSLAIYAIIRALADEKSARVSVAIYVVFLVGLVVVSYLLEFISQM